MKSEIDAPLKPAEPGRWSRIRGYVTTFIDSLAGRLLMLTAAAVLAAEALMFAPALTDFHESWLRDRINLAQTAALAAEVAPDYEVAEALRYELLENAEVLRIAMKRGEDRELILDAGAPTGELTLLDYTHSPSWTQRFIWSAQAFFAPPGRTLRVLARPRFEGGEYIEIVLNEAPLKRSLNDFALQFALVSSLILMAAASLMLSALNMAFVRPIERLTRSIERFRERPEDASIEFMRSARADEIGRAERAAADMAEQIRISLRQRERLASLGAAVARIGHDLRNMLATARLVTERLTVSEDPDVRQVAPRLERAIDRAAALATTTLRFGRADEPPPLMQPVETHAAVAEAAADAVVGLPEVPVRLEIDEDLFMRADPEHAHRVLVNLIRNAAQAMAPTPRAREGVFIHAYRLGAYIAIEIVDHGPGVPGKVRATLFEPFVSADPQGSGAGLGLAIARELARGMGGDVALLRSNSEGAAFRIVLPSV
jgi:signal transduction histidine kinase